MSNNYNKFFNQNKNENINNGGLRQNNGSIDEKTFQDKKLVNDAEFQGINPADTSVVVQNTNDDNFSGTSSEDATSGEPKTGTVENCQLVYLREKSTKSSKAIEVLKEHDPLTIDGISNGWAHVHTHEGIEGYIMERYIKVEK